MAGLKRFIIIAAIVAGGSAVLTIAACADSAGNGPITTVGEVIDAQERRLANDLTFELTVCGTLKDYGYGVVTRGARGTVNNSGHTPVNVYIEVDFENAAGVIVYQGNAWISSLATGRTAQWESPAVVDSFSRCRGRISSVFPS